MPPLPSWPDVHGQANDRGPFSPGHFRYVMIDCVISKSPFPMNSMQSSWGSCCLMGIPTTTRPPKPSHLALLTLVGSPGTHSLEHRPHLSPNLQVPLAIQNP